MINLATPIRREPSNTSPDENSNGIYNHIKAATHFEAAAKHHWDAAKYHQSGDHERAAQSTIAAHGHQLLASEAQQEDIKHHAMNR